MDSISLPPLAAMLVDMREIPLVTSKLLLSTIVPLKTKEETPFADSPFVMMYEISTIFSLINFLPKIPSPNKTSYL